MAPPESSMGLWTKTLFRNLSASLSAMVFWSKNTKGSIFPTLISRWLRAWSVNQSILWHTCHDAHLGRIETGHQGLARHHQFANLHQACRHDPTVGRNDGRVAVRKTGLPGGCLTCCCLRQSHFVVGLRLVERGLADEFLRKQLPRALISRLGILHVGLNRKSTRLAARQRLRRFTLIDAQNHLPLADAIPDIEVDFLDTPSDLGGYGGLARRLYQAVRTVCLRDLAILHGSHGKLLGSLHSCSAQQQYTENPWVFHCTTPLTVS